MLVCILQVPPDRVVKLSDLTTPLAWRSGEPFGILVQATKENFSRIGTAYLEGFLELDDGLLVNQLLCKYLISVLRVSYVFLSLCSLQYVGATCTCSCRIDKSGELSHSNISPRSPLTWFTKTPHMGEKKIERKKKLKLPSC